MGRHEGSLFNRGINNTFFITDIAFLLISYAKKAVIVTLLQHQWKSFWRSRGSGRNLAVQIFLGFIILYLALSALVIGFTLSATLKKFFPAADIVPVFLGFILYYYAFDIMLRFIMQDLPTLAVQPYLAQNIRKRTLAAFLNIRSVFSIFNLLPLFIFIPFIATEINARFGPGACWAMIVSVLSLTIFNHFLVLYIKRKSILSQWWLISFFAVVMLAIAADYFHWFSLRAVSASLFENMLKAPWLCIVPVLLAVASFYNNRRFLLKNFYLENLEKSSGEKRSSEYSWLQRFGNMGDLASVDIRLILRNKRPRSLLLLSVIFLFYGFLFFKPQYLSGNFNGMLLTGAIFITGMFMVSYGQFLFAWQSIHFDGILANNISIRNYIKSKWLLLVTFSTVSFLLSLLYGLMSWKLLPILASAWLFNIGIHSVLTCYLGTLNYKAVDLSKGSTFNYQGTGAVQWLYSLIILLVAAAIYFPFSLLINSWAGIAALGIAGLASFLLQDWWIDKIAQQFRRNRYKMMEGFREK